MKQIFQAVGICTAIGFSWGIADFVVHAPNTTYWQSLPSWTAGYVTALAAKWIWR